MESVHLSSLLSDHVVDISDKLYAVSFIQIEGISINDCLNFEEKFRDKLKSTGSVHVQSQAGKSQLEAGVWN